MLRPITSWLVALSLCGGALRGQDTSAVGIGMRLRVRTAPDSPWHYGTFGGVASDSLALGTAVGAVGRRYYGPSLNAIEVRHQNHQARSAHIRTGAAAGAITGAVALLAAVHHCNATSKSNDGPPCALGYVGLPLWAFGGLVAGGGVGAVWPVRHWKRVAWRVLAADGRASPNDGGDSPP